MNMKMKKRASSRSEKEAQLKAKMIKGKEETKVPISVEKINTLLTELIVNEETDEQNFSSENLHSLGTKGPNNVGYIIDYLKSHYDLRFNVVTGRTEFKRKSESVYTLMTDYELNTIFVQIKQANIPVSINLLRSVILSDQTPAFNPFADYFDKLPKWKEGDPDNIGELGATAKTTDDEHWRYCFSKWIVALVACALEDRVVNHTALIFSGQQGIGKTTWITNLVPPELTSYLYCGTIIPGNKDSEIMLSECILINIDELETFSKGDLGALKEHITKSFIRIRRPYGYHPENLIRRASFAGSVNNHEFLSDTTGSRRFLCFEVLSIDYQHSVPIDMVMAQALFYFRNGFKYWFDGEDIRYINKSNEQFRIATVEEELLLAHFDPCLDEDATHFLSTTDILQTLNELNHIPITNAAKQRLGKALKAHGYHRIKRQNRYVYALRQKDPEIVALETRFLPGSEEQEVGGVR